MAAVVVVSVVVVSVLVLAEPELVGVGWSAVAVVAC